MPQLVTYPRPPDVRLDVSRRRSTQWNATAWGEGGFGNNPPSVSSFSHHYPHFTAIHYLLPTQPQL